MSQTLDLKKPESWKGVWTALITPLTADLQLDVASLETLMEQQIAGGVTGLVIAGSTGEGSTLPEATLKNLFTESQRIAKKRIPLVAGLGINGTEVCLRNGALAKAAGFSGLLASPPAYIKAPQRGLKLHFGKIAELGLPVCLYEIPGRAASSLQVGTMAELVASNPLLIATKDATGDLGRMVDCAGRIQNKIAYLSGDDLSYHGFLCHGGLGVISVAAHFLPKTFVKMTKLVAGGNLQESLRLQAKIQKFTESLFCESNPIPTKSLMKKLGVIKTDVFAPPLVPMDEALLLKSYDLFQALKKEGVD
jgi:4-hydroxy-tetrahydrodipicolinate synthase